MSRFRTLALRLAAPAATLVLGATIGVDTASAHQAHCDEPAEARLLSPGLVAEPVASFDQPLYVTSAPGDPARVFVVERGGRVRVIVNGRPLARPYLDVSKAVSSAAGNENNERGMQSIAFAPDYARSGRMYAFYTDAGGDVRVDEFRRAGGNPDRARASSRRSLLTVEHSEHPVHYGGQLQFGRDGKLWVSLGDADQGDRAQDSKSLLGKLVRLDPRLSRPKPTIFARGLRNPFRFSFDRKTGDLAIADVGNDDAEEVDFLPAGRGGVPRAGANFGWPVYEGRGRRQDGQRIVGRHTGPALSRGHDVAHSITGGYVVRDPELPSMNGRYLYGDFCDGAVRSAVLGARGAAGDRDEGLVIPYVASFGEDARGQIYAASLLGTVYRLRAR